MAQFAIPHSERVFFLLMLSVVLLTAGMLLVVSCLEIHASFLIKTESSSSSSLRSFNHNNSNEVTTAALRVSTLASSTNSADSTVVLLRFSNCNHTDHIMFGIVPLNETNTLLKFTNPQFPSNFACSTIVLSQFYDIPERYQQSFFAKQKEVRLSPTGIQYNLCEVIGNYEKQLQKQRGIMNCSQLLCDSDIQNVVTIVDSLTRGNTSLVDWINYCRYCKSEGISEVCLRSPSSGDAQVRAMLQSFPTGLQYCGMDIFGLPFLVKTNQITPQTSLLTYFSNYSYLCYCPALDTFAFSCSTALISDDPIQLYFQVAVLVLAFAVLVFVFFIPKLWKLFKTRSGSFITSCCVMLTAALTLAHSLISIVVPPPLSITISTHLQYFALISILYSVYSWLLGLYRLISLAKDRQAPKSYYVIHAFLICVFLAIGVVTSVVIATQNDESKLYLLIAEVCLGVIVAVFFVVGSVWAYVVMKKISDVNLMRTDFVRFVLYSTFVIIVFSTSFLLAIIFNSSNPSFAAVCGSIGRLATYALFVAVVYADFDQNEFREFYAACSKFVYKCVKKAEYSSYQETSGTSWVTMDSASVNADITTSSTSK
ncbi:hypothetical protein FDP41_008696 [Naegleria fowleri]|uniref:Uncharacterized protein n=1 Tax=Naegleria fowleri TaxID=5763 RepID=A0A6A5BDX5_NAEFO|nr:uncharacterized protein FDP41_008696 [Naegleria fowleri]KAF0973032.1 hypothetical protein FDP41_008696 [Naegleria fowleri]